METDPGCEARSMTSADGAALFRAFFAAFLASKSSNASRTDVSDSESTAAQGCPRCDAAINHTKVSGFCAIFNHGSNTSDLFQNLLSSFTSVLSQNPRQVRGHWGARPKRKVRVSQSASAAGVPSSRRRRKSKMRAASFSIFPMLLSQCS